MAVPAQEIAEFFEHMLKCEHCFKHFEVVYLHMLQKNHEIGIADTKQTDITKIKTWEGSND